MGEDLGLSEREDDRVPDLLLDRLQTTNVRERGRDLLGKNKVPARVHKKEEGEEAEREEE